MREVTTTTVEIQEDFPKTPSPGDVAYRLLVFPDGNFEFYMADFVIEEHEPADLTMGPQASIELDSWRHVGSGFGACTMQELIEKFNEPDVDRHQ